MPGITSNHLHYYLQQYVFENPQNKSWISIDGDLSKEIYNNSKKYLTPFRLERRSGAKEQVHDKDEEYIDYYYLLSSEHQGNISFALATQTALVLRDFNGTLDILIDPENHLSEVPFTENVTNPLLSLLDAYSNITESTDGQQALANIRLDVLTFREKTVEDILKKLQYF